MVAVLEARWDFGYIPLASFPRRPRVRIPPRNCGPPACGVEGTGAAWLSESPHGSHTRSGCCRSRIPRRELSYGSRNPTRGGTTVGTVPRTVCELIGSGICGQTISANLYPISKARVRGNRKRICGQVPAVTDYPTCRPSRIAARRLSCTAIRRGTCRRDCQEDSDGALGAESVGGCAREFRIRGSGVCGTGMREGPRSSAV